MEIAAAVVGAIATTAVTAAASKLTTIIGNRSCQATVKDKAESIKSEVGCINGLINDAGSIGQSVLQTECIEQLRRLACEIEDCVDLFHAGKIHDFAGEIDRLDTKSRQTRARIESYLRIQKCIAAGTRTREEILRYLDLETAQGIVGRSAETAADFHGELRDLLDDPALLDWLVQDLKRLRNTAQGAVVGARTSQGAAVVPQELQAILDDPIHRDWLAKNLLNCLLYFCLFPPNHHVRIEPLLRRWTAEGLVKEDVAAKNLGFFIDNSIIRSIQPSNDGEMETCQATSQVHAFISRNSESQNFLMVCDGATSITELAGARRLSVHPSADVQLNSDDELPRLRTLAVFPADASVGGAPALASYEDVLDFTRYKVLRVLDLKECADLTKERLDNILDDIVERHSQVLMKYLSINLGSNKGISRSIENLNQLETLDLSGSDNILTVFKEVLFLPELKHLLGKFEFSRSEFFRSHSLLKGFLRDKSKLETLDGFVTGSRYGFPDLMSFMRSLRKVKVWCKSDASQKKLDVLSSAITEFIRNGTEAPYRGLSLSIDFEACSTEFLNEIVPVVAGTLDSLELRGNLSQFPPFVAGLSKIKELCLCFTGLSWMDIREGLSGEKGLKYLKLTEDNLGRIEIQPAHLRSIERIRVVSVQNLDMAIQAGALPQLVSLHILCENLDVNPGNSGIEITHMTKLKEVGLHSQIADGIKAEWKKAVDDHANRPGLILLPIQGA